MRNREEVIKGLEVCVSREPGGNYICDKCPYEVDGNDCEINSIKDAIAMLKEQGDEITALSIALAMYENQDIVRCKDCKYMERLPWLDDEDSKAMVCRKHNYTGMRKEDFFCADGERKTNDG